MNPRLFLALGRISNLPTIVTNVAVGLTFGGDASIGIAATLLLAMALFYTGGMFLNDVFDASFDRQHKSDRPIAQELVGVSTVARWGGGQLILAVGLLALGAWFGPQKDVLLGLAIGLILSVLILLYNAWHKANPLSPVIMGLCRSCVVIGSALIAGGTLSRSYLGFAFVLVCLHVVGLTYAAKLEHQSVVAHRWPLLILAAPFVWGIGWIIGYSPESDGWPVALSLAWLFAIEYQAIKYLLSPQSRDVGRAISMLIAGICIIDAMLIAALGSWGLAALCALGYPATRFSQRYIAGT